MVSLTMTDDTGASVPPITTRRQGSLTEQLNAQAKEMPVHSTGARREKLGSNRYDYMPSREVNEAYSRVATFGAKKYDTDNWMKGLPMSQITSSLERHLWAFMSGEDFDNGEGGSGLCHLDHILWNAVALVYFRDKGTMDDRFSNRITTES